MDLSKLSDSDLKLVASGNVNMMSTAGLQAISGNNQTDTGLFAGHSLNNIPQNVGNVVAGAVRGAGSIGSTLLTASELTPGGMLHNLINKQSLNPMARDAERRQGIDSGLQAMGADPTSGLYQTGKLGGEMAGTAGVGNVLSIGAKAMPMLAKYAPAIASGGFNLAGAATGSKLANTAIRAGAGATTGAAAGGLLDPDNALTTGMWGAALPSSIKAIGGVGKAVGSSVIGKVSSEAATLYQKAKDLGINIPLDRLTNSKPLNAIAASLNYIPLSGRPAVEQGMESQINNALSNTFGQNTPNVSMALRAAPKELGAQFKQFLTGNNVNITDDVIAKMEATLANAKSMLNEGDYKILENQYHDLISKVDANGVVQGQAAYNVKKNLDSIGGRNSNEAAGARSLKEHLMDAYNASVSPQAAQDFGLLRKQWGNMKDLENLAQNGADGNISVARLAGLKNIGNNDVQDLADIAAQFVKQRESQHGAAQRVFGAGGILGAGMLSGGLPAAITALPATMLVGRIGNTLLNSNALKQKVLNKATQGQLPKGLLDELLPYLSRATPALVNRGQ